MTNDYMTTIITLTLKQLNSDYEQENIDILT